MGMRAGNGRGGVGAVSFGGLKREGELGPGLALPQDDFLLLLLLPLAVLLQLHALLVNLSLLLHNTQLLLSLSHNTTGQTVRSGRVCVCVQSCLLRVWSKHILQIKLVQPEDHYITESLLWWKASRPPSVEHTCLWLKAEMHQTWCWGWH